jgi:hypothetical protein
MDVTGAIEGIRRYAIHGQPYALLYFSRADDRETIHQAQLSEDALPADIRVGDPIVITYIGAVVVGVRRA